MRWAKHHRPSAGTTLTCPFNHDNNHGMINGMREFWNERNGTLDENGLLMPNK